MISIPIRKNECLEPLLILRIGLLSEHVTAVEWEKTQLQELDITATDLSTECLMDLLTRLTSLRWLSVGQQDGLNDSVCGNR